MNVAHNENRRDDPLRSVPRLEDVRAETRQRETAIGSLEGTLTDALACADRRPEGERLSPSA